MNREKLYNMKRLGIIGGLGPLATAYFLQLLTQMSDANTDQEHMELCLISRPSIPDRTNYILGLSDLSPVTEMSEAGKQLKALGAELLAMPCVTGHYFQHEIEESSGLPMVDAISETVEYLRGKHIGSVGVLATDGTIRSRLFQCAMENGGVRCIIPDENAQKRIMEIIYREIKAGKKVNIDDFLKIAENLRQQGAEVILLACTELSLLKKDYQIGKGFLDVMEVLAAKVVELCNRLKTEYRELIT